MLPGKRSYSNVGGLKGTTVTPAHQDNYFFRSPHYYTTWIPLMDIDESVGGLAIADASHRSGYYQHWFRGSEQLGVPQNADEARSWSASGGSPATGDVKAEDLEQRWLNADYRAGDVLIFAPMMLHRGLENTSDKIRISADIRYQKRGTPTVWRARHRFTYSQNYAAKLRETVGGLGLEPSVALRVVDRLYVEGPTNVDLRTRAQATAK
jgi:ectoine hydroxylase-related dioxygenase (phytanoyl-CoA dioxygenase family)